MGCEEEGAEAVIQKAPSNQPSIASIFADQAASHGECAAIVSAAGSVTYRDLDERSDAVARSLLGLGIEPGSTVALHLPRSADAVVVMLGVLKAGACYLPLDTGYPRRQLEYICADAAPAVLVTDGGECVAGLSAPGATVLTLAELLGPSPGAARQPAGSRSPGPDDPCYIMYTSGSTGRPKGVIVPHRAVVRLVVGNSYADLGPDETILQLAPLAFDASTFEIWGALLNGGRLAILGGSHPSLEEIAEAIARLGVTTAWLTAGLFHMMVYLRLEGLRPLRQLLAGGDVLSPTHVTKVLRALPTLSLINGYGPTENTTFSCCYRIPPDYSGATAVPIGPAIRGTTVHLLDEAGHEVGAGEVGELCVGGSGVALGYLNRPELTAEKFIPDPFSGVPGARLYRTGDRARLLADGVVEFLGRNDRQVKINGKRVELDELEAVVHRSGLVGSVATLAVDVQPLGKRVVAFVTPCTGSAAVAIAALQAYLHAELADYMRPSSIIELPELPLTPQGKLDRQRLLERIETKVASPPAPAHGGSVTETAVQRLWNRTLGLEAPSLDENFFDAGATSMMLTRLHAALRAELSVDVALVDLFDNPTIRKLAARIDRHAGVGADTNERSAADRGRRQQDALRRARQARRPGTAP